MHTFPAAIIGGVAHMGETPLAVLDPATGQPAAEIGIADAALVDAAVTQARAAYEGSCWRTLGVDARQASLRACADIIEANAERLADLECLNTGIPLDQIAGRQIARTATNFRFFADYISQSEGRLHEQHPQYLTLVRREAVGVAALISPWNAPLALASMKIAAAIAFGNCCVIKPSEIAPLGVTQLVTLLGEVSTPV
ncbi:MAG: aldehyde dehydrogenase family protein [Polymorphobacter sp.]